MTDVDPVNRLDAKEAKDRLGTIFYSMAPESLLFKPDDLPRSDPFSHSDSNRVPLKVNVKY